MRKYRSPNFSVLARQLDDCVILTQEIHNSATTTKDLPSTFSVLNQTIPSIFDNYCYNQNKYSFKKEVKNTEVGHLYEHLILENLKIFKIDSCGKADVRGETHWDWIKDKKGTFNIVVYSDRGENGFFNKALGKATEVLEMIYATQKAGMPPAF